MSNIDEEFLLMLEIGEREMLRAGIKTFSALQNWSKREIDDTFKEIKKKKI